MALDDGWKSEHRAAEVLKELQIPSLPVDPFHIAERRDILVQENPALSSGISGCLMKMGDNFGIIYSSRFSSEGFKRFTVAHELGHYFMDGHALHLGRVYFATTVNTRRINGLAQINGLWQCAGQGDMKISPCFSSMVVRSEASSQPLWPVW